MNEKQGIAEREYTSKNMVSFSIGYLGSNLMMSVIHFRYIHFYIQEVGLAIEWILIAIVFYTVWDMINDPLVGLLTDRNYTFTRRWGRRFPWIMCSIFPLCLFFVLFYLPPDPANNEFATFLWFLIMLSLFDGFFSIIFTSTVALLYNKFRNDRQRTKVSILNNIMGAGGVVLAGIIPPSMITYGVKESYVQMTLVVVIIYVIVMLLNIPGIREDETLIDTYFIEIEGIEKKSFFEDFKSMMKFSLKQRNFIAMLVSTLFMGLFTELIVATVPFFVQFNLGEEAYVETLIILPYLLGVLIFAPISLVLAKKYGDIKVFKISVMFSPVPSLILFFINLTPNLLLSIIFIFIMGANVGIFNVLALGPVWGHYFDEAAIKIKERKEGIYQGIYTFFRRISYFLMIICYTIVFNLTGYVEGSPTQTETAKLGINILMNLIPAIAAFCAAITFIILWTLTPEDVERNKEKLKELGI